MNLYVILIKAHYALLNSILLLTQRILFRPVTSQVLKVLVVRKGNLGDLVCSLQAFEAIKTHFAQASIHLLTTHGVQSDLGASSVIPQGYFHSITEFRSFTVRALLTKMKREKYDVVIELPADVETMTNQVRNMFFYRMAGITRGAGWRVTRTQFLSKKQIAFFTFDNEQKRLQDILERCGINTSNHRSPELFSQSDREKMQQLVGKRTDKLVAIAVGAKISKKQWPLAYFKKVIEFLQKHEYTIVAVGDVSDDEKVKSMGIEGIHNVCGMLTIAESAALLSLCQLTVCNDSGPMHLSYTVGTPVCALFSARNYKGKWNPPKDNRNSVFSDYSVSCAGCMNKPCDDNICMKNITPEEVIQSIKHVLQL